MKKDEYRSWFSDQLKRQSHLLIGAVAALIGLGLVAAVIEAVLFAAILHFGLLHSAWPMSFLIVLGIQGTMLVFVFLRIPKQLGDAEHDVELEDGFITVRTAPTMTSVWTYALGSLETDQTWIERLFTILALPQRLFCAAFNTWQRMMQLKTIDINDCSAVVRLLHRKAERIEICDVDEELQLPDPTTTFRNLSLIDGIIFLKQKSMGLSLANRLVDEMEEWSKKTSKTQE